MIVMLWDLPLSESIIAFYHYYHYCYKLPKCPHYFLLSLFILLTLLSAPKPQQRCVTLSFSKYKSISRKNWPSIANYIPVGFIVQRKRHSEWLVILWFPQYAGPVFPDVWVQLQMMLLFSYVVQERSQKKRVAGLKERWPTWCCAVNAWSAGEVTRWWMRVCGGECRAVCK